MYSSQYPGQNHESPDLYAGMRMMTRELADSVGISDSQPLTSSRLLVKLDDTLLTVEMKESNC